MDKKKIFYFGEKIKDFDIRVLNEREVRASAGILFFFAMIAFMNAWLKGNFYSTKIFVIGFIIDFIIRIFINPKYAPSLIIARFFVQNQKPEYTGAPQKKFAWIVGLILAITMFFLVIINNIIGPINLIICLICLTLLFFESIFDICIGCKIYNLLNKDKAKLCPGGICEKQIKEEIQKINFLQIGIVIIFVILIISLPTFNIVQNNKLNTNINQTKDINTTYSNHSIFISENNDCEVPEWAIKIGHEEMWKLHHNCK